MKLGMLKGLLLPVSCIFADRFTNGQYSRSFNTHFVNAQCDSPMKLVYASVYFRHGTRTPVWVMDQFKEFVYPSELIYQPEDPSKPSLPHKVINLENNEEGAPESYFEIAQSKRFIKGGCGCGQLTKKGWQDAILLGEKFRSRYIEEYRLIDDSFDNAKIRSYSTNMNRTLDSLKGVLIGLFGDSINEENPAIIYTRPIETEYNFPNCIFSKILEEYASWVHGTEYSIPQCMDVREKIYQTFGNPTTISISVLWDSVNSITNNGLPVSEEIRTLRDELEGCVAKQEKRSSFGENPKIMKCAFGKILDDIIIGFEDVIRGESNFKLSLTACHDTTLLALTTAAGGFQAKWPDMGSYISFELFKDSIKEEYYVRATFDGEVIKGAMADEDGFVPLSIFVEKQEPVRLRESWTTSCVA